MFVNFFHELRAAGLPVTLKEYLTLMEALEADLANRSVEDFYYLSRAALVKDERHLDRFDQVFGHVFKGLELMSDAIEAHIPEEWLRAISQLYLSEEEKRKIEELGGWEKIMEELRKRLAEQKGRHQGGSKWIGTAGTSPYGAYGYNPAAYASARRRTATSAPSRCGTSVSFATSTTRWRSAPATSRSRCAACAASPARAPRRSSTSTAPSGAPRTRAISTCKCGPSGATR
jgi:Uncharacterized protein conserved in bacteria